MKRSIFSASLLLLLLAGRPDIARARGEPDRFTAHYQRAANLYTSQRYREALRELEAAYALQPFPRLLYNLGQVHRKLNHTQQALSYYELYLRTEPGLQPARRAEVEAYIAQLGGSAGLLLAAKAERPLHRRWWFWVALGGGTAATVAVVASVLAFVVQPAPPPGAAAP